MHLIELNGIASQVLLPKEIYSENPVLLPNHLAIEQLTVQAARSPVCGRTGFIILRSYSEVGTRYFFRSPLPLVRYLEIVLFRRLLELPTAEDWTP